MGVHRRRVLGSAGLAMMVGSGVQAQSSVRLVLATLAPDASLQGANVRHFAGSVSQATSGRLAIDVIAGGQLGFSGAELLAAVRDGLVPMADMLTSQQAADEPLLGVWSLPFIASDIDELAMLHRHVQPELDRMAAANNQTILCTVPWPAQSLCLKARAEAIEGLAGVAVRVPDRNVQDICRAIGMAPALIPWAETRAALAAGSVAGVSTSAASAIDGKLWQVLSYFQRTNHVWACQMLAIGNDSLGRISPADRGILLEVAKRLEPAFWRAARQAEGDDSARLAAAGMQPVVPSRQMMDELRRRTQALRADYMKRVPVAEPAIRAYLAEIKRA